MSTRQRQIPVADVGDAVIFDKVTRSFEDGTIVFDGLDLAVPRGQFIAILGPSGCGKSTLLRLVAGLDKPQGGSVTIAPESKVAYVFQEPHLLPWRTARDNVALPLELMGVGRAERLGAARAALAQVDLEDAAGRYPHQLSGGMRMRVSLARAMVTHPQLLLLDEPFGALDEITRQQLDMQLRGLWERLGITVLFVTHSISEAAFLAERVIVLSRRPARVAFDRTIDLPSPRRPEIRTETSFARTVHELFEALSGVEA